MKVCSVCEERKPLDTFPPDLRRKDGRGSKCRPCVEAVSTVYYSRYPEKEAERRQRNAEHGKRWYRENRDRINQRLKWKRIFKLYGLTKQAYFDLLSFQKTRCAICKTDDPGREDKHFSVDHCHTTGDVRGLLCQRCNSGIGFFSDDPDRMRAAARYVEKTSNSLKKHG